MFTVPRHPFPARRSEPSWQLGRQTPSGSFASCAGLSRRHPPALLGSKLNRSYAVSTSAKSILYIRVLLSPRIWPARFTGISRIRVTAKASNSWVKCVLRPSQGGFTGYTFPSLLPRPRGTAQTITHSLLKTFRCRHCIGTTWSWQVTDLPACALSSGQIRDSVL